MRVDMYLRTYEGDYKWLPYLFKSIEKFVTGYQHIIIQAPEDQLQTLRLPKWPEIVFIPAQSRGKGINKNTGMPDDYNGQQIDKLYAWHYCEAGGAVLFLDSDCVFTRPVDVSCDEDLWVGDRPVLWYTPWKDVGPALCWKEPVYKILDFEPEAETMRRHPMIHIVEVLRDLYNYIDQPLTQDRISEFNLMGNFALMHYRHLYDSRDTSIYPMPPPLVRQFWSWGGLEAALPEIKAILGEDCP